MTPSARAYAAIEIIQKVLDGSSVTRVLLNWGRTNRYAGAKDRSAIRDMVFNAIRYKRSSLWPFINSGFEASGRYLIMGSLYKKFSEFDAFFDDSKYSAPRISAKEWVVLESFSCVLDQAPLPVRLDFPDFLLPELKRSLGGKLEETILALNRRASVFLRVNFLRCDVDEAISSLGKDGIVTKKCNDIAGCLVVERGEKNLQGSRAYQLGFIEIQDLSSQSVIKFIKLSKPKMILDFCAGGGGKVLAVASEVQGAGKFYVHDKKWQRMKNIDDRTKRAGVKINRFYPHNTLKNFTKFDLVLVDVPCSGTGSWRRDPGNKWWLTKDKLNQLIAEQKEIIGSASKYVAEGGIYVYITCSILQRENEDQVDEFLACDHNFNLLRSKLFSPVNGGDGFYVAVMKKQKK